MIGLMVLGLSNPAEKQPDACEESEKMFDDYGVEYPSCKDLAAPDPNAVGYHRNCEGGFNCGGTGDCSDNSGMKYRGDYLEVEKVDGCSGKACPYRGRLHGNYFSGNRDRRSSWAQFPSWTTLAERKGYCYVEYGYDSDSKDGYNLGYVDDSYADDRFNITDGVDIIELGGPYSGHYRFGCDDDAPSTFNSTFDYYAPLTAIKWPPSETHKCKKGARSYYFKYDQKDGEYYIFERTLTDFWGTVKKTTEEQNGIRRNKVKIGLSNKLTVAAGIGISVAVSAVIVAIGCLIFYFVCKSKVAVKS